MTISFPLQISLHVASGPRMYFPKTLFTPEQWLAIPAAYEQGSAHFKVHCLQCDMYGRATIGRHIANSKETSVAQALNVKIYGCKHLNASDDKIPVHVELDVENRNMLLDFNDISSNGDVSKTSLVVASQNNRESRDMSVVTPVRSYEDLLLNAYEKEHNIKLKRPFALMDKEADAVHIDDVNKVIQVFEAERKLNYTSIGQVEVYAALYDIQYHPKDYKIERVIVVGVIDSSLLLACQKLEIIVESFNVK